MRIYQIKMNALDVSRIINGETKVYCTIYCKLVLGIRIPSDPDLFGRIRTFLVGSGFVSKATKFYIFFYPFCDEKFYEYFKIHVCLLLFHK
jgi:hypothetical protein